LRLFPDHVDLGIVGDGFQGDVRGALVDEALADVAVGGGVGLDLAGDFLFLRAALTAVGEFVIGIFRAHQPGAGQCESDAGGIDGNPAPPPLLGHHGRSAGTASWIEHQIAGIGRHQDTAFNYVGTSLNNINFGVSAACHSARYI
jgi:hypothetical protein